MKRSEEDRRDDKQSLSCPNFNLRLQVGACPNEPLGREPKQNLTKREKVIDREKKEIRGEKEEGRKERDDK